MHIITIKQHAVKSLQKLSKGHKSANIWCTVNSNFFLTWVLRPFQEYFTYIEPIVHQRWAKTGEPGEKPRNGKKKKKKKKLPKLECAGKKLFEASCVEILEIPFLQNCYCSRF